MTFLLTIMLMLGADLPIAAYLATVTCDCMVFWLLLHTGVIH